MYISFPMTTFVSTVELVLCCLNGKPHPDSLGTIIAYLWYIIIVFLVPNRTCSSTCTCVSQCSILYVHVSFPPPSLPLFTVAVLIMWYNLYRLRYWANARCVHSELSKLLQYINLCDVRLYQPQRWNIMTLTCTCGVMGTWNSSRPVWHHVIDWY